MDGAAGEEGNAVLRVTFDPRLKLEFHGSKVTSDAGLLPFRDLDEALGLTDLAGDVLAETRAGQNSRHTLIAQLRQCKATGHIASKATARFTSCRLRLRSSDRTVLRCGGDPGPTAAPGARAEHQRPQLSPSRSGRGPQAVPCLSLTLTSADPSARRLLRSARPARPSAVPRKGRCRRNS